MLALTGLPAACLLAQPTAPVAAPARIPATAPASALPAADAFFTDPALAETRALIVLQDGKRLYERYGSGIGPGTRLISWSMAKSITATLIGELVGDGRLELDTPAPVPEWRDDPRGRTTLRQLLHMASGVKHLEAGPAPERSDTNRALFADTSADIYKAAVAEPAEVPPGTRFQYNTLTSHILARLVSDFVAGPKATPDQRRRAVRTFINERLAAPAGMASLLCEFDPAGNFYGGSLCHATARDWAAFGQMYLDRGVVAGVQVVRPDWVTFVTTPSPTNPGYGGQFWLNRKPVDGKDEDLFWRAGPADAFAAIGHLGQYVIVVPSRRLVVVRLGKTQDEDLQPVRDALARLVNAFPAVAP
ncbi:serine hydrolase domain-containing protein [Sandarakinorhabdus rubra]|uniref:serine hydrolase domain-containing protein n=1 Tax=Sandarakinorhabdus rubra TaxID=2672568 RepID=UPI001F205A7E|nr:serine hydrolase [Sandarakinorhabdus rubra]